MFATTVKSAGIVVAAVILTVGQVAVQSALAWLVLTETSLRIFTATGSSGT